MADDAPELASSRRDFLATAAAAVATAAVIGGCQPVADLSSSGLADDKMATVPQNGLFEMTLNSSRNFVNPFWDAVVEAQFTAPSGRHFRVEGFYDGDDQWRVRFVPNEKGPWRFANTLRTADGKTEDRRSGQFLCEGVEGHGFVRPSTRNRFRMEYEDSTPFYPIGVQTCNLLTPDCDGPNADGTGRSVSNAQWVDLFAGAVNLVRTQLGQATRNGCAFPLLPVGGPADRYDVALGRQLDEAFLLQRKRGISQILILFQDMSLWGQGKGQCIFGSYGGPESYKSLKAASLPVQEKYLRYIVARYAAFIDIWEMFNEDSFAEDDYLAHLAKVIRAADPYRHPITTNYSHPAADWCEIVTFHEYMGMPANEVDAYLSTQFGVYKAYGKVVQNTEFGNQRNMPNVDPVKWRIAVWTAFMHECGLLFWSMSQHKLAASQVTKGNANAYLGPDSRQHFRVLANFTSDLPIDLRPTPVGFTTHRDIRLYGLTNGRTSALYVHHFADHHAIYTRDSQLDIWTGPAKFRLRWIDPATGEQVATATQDNPQQFLQFDLPPLKVDLACRIDRLE